MITSASIVILLIVLVFMIVLSGFFSSSETGMMSLNRYRLKHLAKMHKHRAARRTKKLLERPDRLLGIILIGNTFANVCASSVTTILALHLFGDLGAAIATFVLTMIILIFSEMAPKTFAALHPEGVAFTFSLPLRILLILLYPLVWFANLVANGLLFLFGVRIKDIISDPLSREELRVAVFESGGKISTKHQNMLISILDLESVSVEDIMVSRSDIIGIDLDDDWDAILDQLLTCQHTRLLVYRNDIDNVLGMLHSRQMLSLMSHNKLNKESIEEVMESIYFMPESTPLSTQLINFQRENRRIGLVVDEYGDIQGLVTLEDILEEIVGEFTTDFSNYSKEIHPQQDGTFMVDGSIHVRKLNRMMKWHLSAVGPKTLSGLVIEKLEMIPRAGTCLKINNYAIEVVQVKDNMIRTLRILPMKKETKL